MTPPPTHTHPVLALKMVKKKKKQAAFRSPKVNVMFSQECSPTGRFYIC
jgi:hypothetical protein